MSLQPTNDANNEEQAVKVQFKQTEAFSGPIPPPEDLGKYNTIVPGAGDRILKMAEAEQANRHSQETTVLRLNGRGQFFSFIIRLLGMGTWAGFILSGTVLALQGQTGGGMSLIGGTALVWVAVTLYRLFKSNGDSSELLNKNSSDPN